MLKLIALLAAGIAVFLFLRAMFGRRPSKISAAWGEAKKQLDTGITIFLGIVGVVVAITIAKLIWAWWVS